MRFGLVFVKPWNDGGWRRPSFTTIQSADTGWKWRRVALSFNRAAIVFDINWYLEWLGARYNKPANSGTLPQTPSRRLKETQ